jgi:hypothetical protein
LQSAGKAAQIHIYAKCGSNFMDPENPHFEGPPDQTAIADAWTKIDAHLAKELASRAP